MLKSWGYGLNTFNLVFNDSVIKSDKRVSATENLMQTENGLSPFLAIVEAFSKRNATRI